MSQRRLPPLNAIRAFDAVARQGNMSKASLELGVSPPTVTHHLQTLEEFLGIKLVVRTSNSMSLTKKGKAYSEAIRHGFDILTNATDALVQDEINDPLRISCVPTLSNAWFANRLTELEKQYPGLDIQCDFSPTPVSFDQDRYDLAIRYGEGHYPDADSQLLFVDKVAPVCAPELAQRIRESNDLLEVPRLRSPEMTPDQRSLWYHWGLLTFGKEFADKIDVTGGTILQSARFIVEALKVNECVALLDYASVSAELRSGHLASPLGLWVDAPFGYHLLTPKRRTPRAPVRVLKVLLKRNIHEMQYKEKD
ncbi:MAG TPA: LysR substrate-binding domain-containing protein [Pararhizobium sp.]|nr:LysR substrate-binding domain-containing protein [Pararhizobium sp.]